MHNTAIATGVLPHNGKQSNYLLLLWWTPKAGVTSSNLAGRAIFEAFAVLRESAILEVAQFELGSPNGRRFDKTRQRFGRAKAVSAGRSPEDCLKAI